MKVIGKIYNHIDFIILTGISVFFLPFLGSSSTIDPVLTPRFFVWTIVTLVLFVSFAFQLYRFSKDTDCSFLKRIIFPAFLAYFAFGLISLFKAQNITEGIYEVLKILVSIVYLFLATVILSRNKDYIPTLIKAVVISAVILSLTGFYEYCTLFLRTSGACNIKATMGQKNQFSSALFLMLPFCLYAGICYRRFWSVIATLSAVSLLTLILLNQTRSVWLAIFMSTCVTTIIVVLLCIFRKSSILKETKVFIFKRLLYVAIALVLAGMILGYFHLRSNSIDSLVDQAKSIFSTVDKRNVPRISMWRKTLEPIQKNIFLCTGAGNWKIVFPSYGIEDLPRKDMFKTTFFVRPENDYVWVLSELGIFGFMLYLSVFAIVISYIFRIIFRSSSSNDILLSISIFFGITGYMVFSCFTFPRERIFHSMFLLLMMAIVISIYHRSFGYQKNVSRLLVLTLAVPCMCLLLLAIFIGYARMNAEVHTKRAFAARRAKNWSMVISEIDKAHSVFATLDPMSTPLKWHRGEANFLLNNIPQALEDFKEAYKAHPYHIHVLNNLATCYELQGNHSQAIRFYKKALEIFPGFEDALINLGAAYYNSGQYQAAYKTLLQCNQNTQNPKLQQYLEAAGKKIQEK